MNNYSQYRRKWRMTMMTTRSHYWALIELAEAYRMTHSELLHWLSLSMVGRLVDAGDTKRNSEIICEPLESTQSELFYQAVENAAARAQR